jgi:hypothetical protein
VFFPLKHQLNVGLALLALLLLALVVYLPGINGPFVFDDTHNILTAELVRMDQLNMTQALDAVYSAGTRLPNRGLARLTFALDYYFSGTAYDSRTFKLTNICIHLLNGVLVFLLARALLLRCAGATSATGASWAALFAAALWVLHPLQLTSVLYVVQRMTSLSALFVFAGLLTYVYGRARVQRGERYGLPVMALGLIVGTALGLLCKENAALLPFLAYVTDRVFFPAPTIDQPQHRQLRAFHFLFVGLPVALALAAIAWSWSGFVAGFEQGRDFTMGERLLTQPRVLFMYVSLFLFPSLRALSLHHDDFVISTTLLGPPSTLLAVIALLVLVGLAWYRLRSGAMWAFAAVFFTVGHAIESSFLPLEMVHEHRNYLPTFALAVLLAHALLRLTRVASTPVLMACVLGVSVPAALSAVTWARVGIWSSARSLAEYGAEQHPNSYRSLAHLAAVKAQQNGTAQELYSSYRHIAQINNTVVFAVIRMRRIVAAMQFHLRRGTFLGSPAPAEVLAEARWDPQILHLDPGFLARLAESLNAEVRRRLTLSIVGAETAQEFEGLRRCLEQHSDMCVGVVDDALVWLHIALTQATMTDSVRASLLSIAAQHESANGDFKKAAAMLQKARQISPGDPYFLLREALLNGEQGRFAEAEAVLARLSGGQEHSRHDQRSIEATRAALARLRERASLAPGSSEPAKLPAR